jgi:FMN-dependent NADH-azoreductase
MKKLLHIIATPRGHESNTLTVSDVFLDGFKDVHPDWVVEELDLSVVEIPSLSVKRVDGKYLLLSGKDLYGEMKEAWQDILSEIDRFLSADTILISTPMWNFSIPYLLKHYLDVIVQPKYLFRYTAKGHEGLAKGRKVIVITSRDGDYSSKEGHREDFQEPYLRHMFDFIGVTDVTFINAEPMNEGEERKKKALSVARETARHFASTI